MRLKSLTLLNVSLSLIVLGLFISGTVAAEDAPRMQIEHLKALLGNSDVVVIDVRESPSWRGSEYKIKGANREIPTDFKAWSNRYPKDKTLVLY
jgi:hypothetical protein